MLLCAVGGRPPAVDPVDLAGSDRPAADRSCLGRTRLDGLVPVPEKTRVVGVGAGLEAAVADVGRHHGAGESHQSHHGPGHAQN